MPDETLILKAMAAAALTAAVVLLLCAWRWQAPHPAFVRIGGVLGVAMGFYVGCWVLGVRPHWPATEVHDRLLLVLLPALVAVELVGTLPGRLSWLVWPLRMVVAAGAARVLLNGSVYLSESASEESWTPAQTWEQLGGWAASLVVVWSLLALLARRTQSRSIPLAVAVACVGAAIAMMLSGYASAGGQMGFALAAALAGAVVASLVLAGPADAGGILSLGVVCLFALVASGHFFGELTLANAALLFFGPLLCWLPELPPPLRGFGRVMLAAIPVALALVLAQQGFVANSSRSSSGSEDPGSLSSPSSKPMTLQEYMDSLGK
jgi:hypothetical protein